MKNNNKYDQYPATVAPIYFEDKFYEENKEVLSRTFGKGLVIDPAMYDELMKVLPKIEVGGRFRIFPMKNRAKDITPHAYIKYESKAQVEADERRYQEWKAQQQNNNQDAL